MYSELYVAVQGQKFSRKESISACISNYYKVISHYDFIFFFFDSSRNLSLILWPSESDIINIKIFLFIVA